MWKLETCLWLAFALVAFLIVNSFKFNYQQGQNAAQKEVQTLMDGFQELDREMGAPEDWFTRSRSDYGGTPNAYIWAWKHRKDFWRQPNVYFEDLKHGMTNLKHRLEEYDPEREHVSVEKLFFQFREFLGIAHDWRKSDNIWDSFKMLVATTSRFWWTQQWFMGYMTWALFLTMSSKHSCPTNYIL